MDLDISLSESEFFSENTQIAINPNFRHQGMSLLSGTFGPFRPSVPVTVPLWLGIYLKRQQKCHIIPPAWMDSQVLKDKFRLEEEQESFTEIDFYYMEISSLLLTYAKDDIENQAVVCRLIQDLHDLRTSKIRNSLQKIDPNAKTLQLNNIASIELHLIRKLLPATLDIVKRLK